MIRALTLIVTLMAPVAYAAAQEGPSSPRESNAQAAPAPTAAKPQVRAATQSTETPPMRFEWVREGPSEACGDKCREWIAAAGRITADTPRDFETFARTRDLHGATLVLDSSGGAMSGLALGRAIRKLGINTSVGKTVALPASADADKRATLSPKANCASMCAFVLLGGARRHVPADARVLVHQIWPSTKRDDATAANYSALDLVRVQREVGNMARYTLDMGADIELFEIAMRIPPWEALRPLSNADLKRLGVQNSDDPFPVNAVARASVSSIVTLPAAPAAAPASVGPAAATATAVSAAVEPVQAAPATDVAAVPVAVTPSERPLSSTQQWIAAERAGKPEVVRRNPLTIEGDEIGLFELRLSCGTNAEGYTVSYAEHRKQREGEGPGDRLNAALLVIGKERVALVIIASGRSPTGEITAIARGRVPAGAVNEYAEGKIKSLAVATRTSGNTRTLIRVGNTGMAQAFPPIAATCPK